MSGEPYPQRAIEDLRELRRENAGLRELVATLNGKLDNLLGQRCVKCGTTIPGDEVLRQRIQDLEWAEVKVKKLEAELARMRARLGDMTEELGEQVGRQEALEVLGQGSKP